MNHQINIRKIRDIFLAGILICLISITSFGWNKPGHMVTGAIAARELKSTDSQALARVVALLKKHPSYQAVWKSIVNQRAGLDDEAVVLFAYAARWPDDARNTPDHREFWHYINYPFKPDGQPSTVTVDPPSATNIENAFQANIGVLQNAQSTDVQKAKALAWLFHLTGDSHQPLHSSALFTTDYPNGDRGGTQFFVRYTASSAGVKLHAVWDTMIIVDEGFQAVHQKYLSLVNSIRPTDITNISEDDQKEWVQESFILAKENAYLQGTLEGGRTQGTAVKLPNGYITTAKPFAEQRMAAAGYRLADLLGRLF